MRKKLFLLLLLIPMLVRGQRKYPAPPTAHSKPFTKADDDCADKANKCLYSKKYNAKQRRAFFPFNVGGSIKLISFEFYMPKDTPSLADQIFNTQRGNVFAGINPKEFVVDYAKIKEIKDLSGTAIDSLTDILYNIGYTPLKCNVYNADPGASCYEPRNAVLFFDKSGKLVQYLEICFECQRHYYSSRKFKEVEYCEGKYKMLRKFFAAQGVEYGTKHITLAD